MRLCSCPFALACIAVIIINLFYNYFQVCSVLDKRCEGSDGCKPIATCNWGCGSKGGHAQLKLLVQWISASVALIPHLLYHTCAHPDLNMVRIFCS